ncbi:hypothetical protein EV363DRAFT_1439362 [Boletus edulis]|nr:hypothetical protein EV363DRAFT_1439362 [Boletus edulis]
MWLGAQHFFCFLRMVWHPCCLFDQNSPQLVLHDGIGQSSGSSSTLAPAVTPFFVVLPTMISTYLHILADPGHVPWHTLRNYYAGLLGCHLGAVCLSGRPLGFSRDRLTTVSSDCTLVMLQVRILIWRAMRGVARQVQSNMSRSLLSSRVDKSMCALGQSRTSETISESVSSS